MMEKRIWKKPLAVAEKFMPNEYIAACDYKYKYTISCETDRLGLIGQVRKETNNVAGCQLIKDDVTNYDELFSGWSSCDGSHVVYANSLAELPIEPGYYVVVDGQPVDAYLYTNGFLSYHIVKASNIVEASNKS